ncbi:MAG TPA: hypothetical protein VF510_15250 [Ktedonobacterales bacterium]
MANPTSSRPWPFRTTRRLAITAIGGVVAILVVAGTLTLTALNLSHVHASGTGGGGCYPTSGPACTFKGHGGFADFESSSGCVITDINVFASDNFSRSSGSTTSTSDINLSVNSYNNCTGDYSYGWGYDTGTVQFSQGGNTLTAQGNITVDMYSGNYGGTSAGLAGSGTGGGGGSTSTVTYTLNLTWKGFGTPTHSVSDYHTQSPGFIMQSHYTGTSQNAIVSGTLSDGTTNFAATPSIYGESIGATSGNFVVIQK